MRGHRTLFDLDKRILENNLYGVDLNEEAIEICRLSLWIKTAERGKALTSLDHTIRVGNSIVADPAVHPKAFDWQAAFPEVFKKGGFDVVVANPPYVRQELLSPIKPYLESAYRAYHGMADLYVYFYELGLRLLKPGGLLSFIVTNKWMKSGYGEPLRRFFAEKAWMESVVDFGHAKQIFEEADVFPVDHRCPSPDRCAEARHRAALHDSAGATPHRRLEPADRRARAWSCRYRNLGRMHGSLSRVGSTHFWRRSRQRAFRLAEFAGVKPLSGIKTGLNEAFLVDTPTKVAMVAERPEVH